MPSTSKAIAELYQAGLSQPEIARQLKLAPTTVSYHLGRSDRPVQRSREQAAPSVPVAQRGTRDSVRRLLTDGVSRAEIARRLGITKQTVSYHARRLGHVVDERCNRRYDWTQIQRYYDEGHSGRECMNAFGFCAATWTNAVKRGAIVPRPSATPMGRLLVAGTYRGRNNLKLRLIKEGLKRERCERCGLAEWQGAPVSMELHHINGDRLDNRLENLELLCPNCHSQTATHSGRNGHRRPEQSLPSSAASVAGRRCDL